MVCVACGATGMSATPAAARPNLDPATPIPIQHRHRHQHRRQPIASQHLLIPARREPACVGPVAPSCDPPDPGVRNAQDPVTGIRAGTRALRSFSAQREPPQAGSLRRAVGRARLALDLFVLLSYLISQISFSSLLRGSHCQALYCLPTPQHHCV